MAAEIPTIEPLSVIAGDTIKWSKELADYSATEWTLKYRIIGTGIDQTITATADGSGWDVEIAASVLAAVESDVTCRLVGWVESGSEKWTVYDDYLRVKPNLRTASATELQTFEVRTLAVIEAALEDRLTADMQNYQIDGKVVTKIPILELQQLRGVFRALVWRQQNPDVSSITHKAQFNAAS